MYADEISQVFTQTVPLITDEDPIYIEFFSETGQKVYNLTNRVYFQAYVNEDKGDSYDF